MSFFGWFAISLGRTIKKGLRGVVYTVYLPSSALKKSNVAVFLCYIYSIGYILDLQTSIHFNR